MEPVAARAHASELRPPLEIVQVAPGDYVFAGSVVLNNQQCIGAIPPFYSAWSVTALPSLIVAKAWRRRLTSSGQ
jgi:hypothetical protein